MTIIRENQVKSTRKPHRCWGCWYLFPVGSQLNVSVWAEGGEIETSYMCPECLSEYERIDEICGKHGDYHWYESLPSGEIGFRNADGWKSRNYVD